MSLGATPRTPHPPVEQSARERRLTARTHTTSTPGRAISGTLGTIGTALIAACWRASRGELDAIQRPGGEGGEWVPLGGA